jgi:hypothetical protein
MSFQHDVSSRLFATIALLALCSPLIPAQQPQPCASLPNPPRDLSLVLSLKGGQTAFQEGEIIALTARYATETAGKYLLNNRNYDRSGRLDGMEIFCIEPDKGRDPLADYYTSAAGFLGGGLFSEQQLSRGSYANAIELELNEWQSLPPGSYTLSIIGNRVSIGKERDQKSWNNAAMPLQSNPVTFRVVRADPNWQAAQLAAAVKMLDSPNSSEDEKEHAARVLRFLGSEAATRELVRRYWAGQELHIWDWEAGLFGSPYRVVAIQEMRAALRGARSHFKEGFLDTLVTLELQSDRRYSLSQNDPKSTDIGAEPFDAYSAEHKRRIARYKADMAAGKFR